MRQSNRARCNYEPIKRLHEAAQTMRVWIICAPSCRGQTLGSILQTSHELIIIGKLYNRPHWIAMRLVVKAVQADLEDAVQDDRWGVLCKAAGGDLMRG